MIAINGYPYDIKCDKCGETFIRHGIGRHPGIVEICLCCRSKEEFEKISESIENEEK